MGMNHLIKNAYRLLVLGVLLWTALSYRAEQQAQGVYMALQERCMAEYSALPADTEPGAAWTRRCALEVEGSEINDALQALDRAQKPFLAAAVACVALLLAMAGVYLAQRIRKASPGRVDHTPSV